jgi:tRNA (guanosine-2'-O-)-methyltransferase
VDYTQPVALALGTELFGVSEATLAVADTQVKIPMMGVTQSLNVSVACAVVLFAALQQRQAAGLYDRCRLHQDELARQRFEWLHPVLADYCKRHSLAYPALDEEGELAEPMPRAGTAA